MKNNIEFGIEDIKGFKDLESLKSYVNIHYEIYSKETLAKIIYGLIEGVVPWRYCTDKDIYENFIKCIWEEFKLED